MDSIDARQPPEATSEDTLHALIKGALALPPAGTLWADLFGLLVRTPFQRRLENWMSVVEMRLRHLAARDRELFDRLFGDEEFASVLLSATQAAARTHQQEKIELLAAAVSQSAAGTDLSTDLQMLFIRFVDDLTPVHVRLLKYLEEHSSDVENVASYADLLEMFAAATTIAPSRAEFRLLCNDLGSRVLVRFSEVIDDFDGIATSDAILMESSGHGTRVLVTDLGERFLAFVSQASSR
jgi:hypothetical protein